MAETETARENAINGLQMLLESVRNGVSPMRVGIEAVVDRIIEAARAPESQHTRDVSAAQRKALNDPRV